MKDKEYKLLIIPIEMDEIEVKTFDHEPTLEEMQKLVGGLIEVVRIHFGGFHEGIINEEGKYDSAINHVATQAYNAFKHDQGYELDGDYIAGTMIVPLNYIMGESDNE
jgi:hypothetical protein|tara:strand:+ start:582 stop:905 length:324 start_codon:yes stop_codon:yes gene_type:complete